MLIYLAMTVRTASLRDCRRRLSPTALPFPTVGSGAQPQHSFFGNRRAAMLSRG